MKGNFSLQWLCLWIVLVFLSSCSTSSFKNYQKAPLGSAVYEVAKKVDQACFLSPHPQFLGEFYSSSSHTDFQLEGAWKNNFNVFELQILGALGEEMARVDIQDHLILFHGSQNQWKNDPAVKNILLFLSSLGAQKMRSLFCGGYAWPVGKEGEILTSLSDPAGAQPYFSTKVLESRQGTLHVESEINLLPGSPSLGTPMKIKSQFLYGMFKRPMGLTIEWAGTLSGEKVVLQNIHINYNSDEYRLQIEDYE